ACDGACAEANGLRHGHRHAAIFERSGWILAFVLEENPFALIQPGRTFGMCHRRRGVEHAFAKSPHAALIDRAARQASGVEQLAPVFSSTMAKIVGPEPLIEQPNAPDSSAARLTSRKWGMSGARRGSAYRSSSARRASGPSPD